MSEKQMSILLLGFDFNLQALKNWFWFMDQFSSEKLAIAQMKRKVTGFNLQHVWNVLVIVC